MADVLNLDEIDRSRIDEVGGKGAHLGELSQIHGIDVPAGFCLTTAVFRRVMAEAPSIGDVLARLTRVQPDEREAIGVLCAELRRLIEHLPAPAEVVADIRDLLAGPGSQAAYAVRSSATAEDLANASFAGQLDSYLNVVGTAAILEHIRRCWASLFTERATTYRLRNGFDQRSVQMAVVVQQMIHPDAAGVLFTADPVTSNRKVAVVEAVPGLGEALVSGLVSPDLFTVRGNEVVASSIATKERALRAALEGGTQYQPVEMALQQRPALTDAQAVRLTQLGRRIEAHFGRPQDIEWCLVGENFHIVQSRPITTLFPVPAAADRGNHVYVSVGHQQMMTDPMRPLGLSVWQHTTPRPMGEAGGRLFVDVTAALASPASRNGLLDTLGRSDPLIRDALQSVLDRGFVASLPDDGTAAPAGAAPAPADPDPGIVTELIANREAALSVLERDIRNLSGPAVLDFIVADFEKWKGDLFDPRSLQVIMAAIESTWWLNENLQVWLGERNAADTLAQSAPHNVTSEMGLALLDVADAVRAHPDVLAFLQHAADTGSTDDGFLDELAKRAGGAAARDALGAYLDTYGMRCVGEIDITRPRWSEHPAALAPLILGNVRNCAPGEGIRRFDQGAAQARSKEQELLTRVRALPDGASKAAEVKRMTDRMRAFIGYREYPKYSMVSRYFVYKRALLAEAERLVRSGVLQVTEDIYDLGLEELREVVRTRYVDDELRGVIARRREDFRAYGALTPPRVLTSDGEAVNGSYRRDDLPPGALAGLPVSAGTVEGRARVVVDVALADVEAGDILVTRYTDPSCTPLFVAIAGLVTEVGGLMTHGAVIAREYGLPAVVGVDRATHLIQDGQRIRLHGTEGYVVLLS